MFGTFLVILVLASDSRTTYTGKAPKIISFIPLRDGYVLNGTNRSTKRSFQSVDRVHKM